MTRIAISTKALFEYTRSVQTEEWISKAPTQMFFNNSKISVLTFFVNK